MENLKPISHSVSIVAYRKNDIKYGATIAWGCQVDYDKMVFLMGSQSVTGKNINKGDIIGISCLGEEQLSIADHFGLSHSDVNDKFNGVDYIEYDNAILIKDSYSLNVCEVIDILHLDEIECDNLIYVKVLKMEKNKQKPLRLE